MKLNNLTTHALSRFIGGQLIIWDPQERYRYCQGEIAEVSIEGTALKVKFLRLVKKEDGGRWVSDENPNYSLSLWFDKEKDQPLCSVQDLAKGCLRISPESIFVKEILTFFPPGVDPAMAAKLILAN